MRKTKFIIHFPDRDPAVVWTEPRVREILAEYDVTRVFRLVYERENTPDWFCSSRMVVTERSELSFV